MKIHCQKLMWARPIDLMWVSGEKVSDIVRLLKSKPTAADSNSGDPEQTSRDVWKTHESEQENKYVLPSYVSWIIYLYIGIMQVLIDPPAKEKHSLWLCHVFSVWGTKSYIQHIWGTKSCLASVHLWFMILVYRIKYMSSSCPGFGLFGQGEGQLCATIPTSCEVCPGDLGCESCGWKLWKGWRRWRWQKNN